MDEKPEISPGAESHQSLPQRAISRFKSWRNRVNTQENTSLLAQRGNVDEAGAIHPDIDAGLAAVVEDIIPRKVRAGMVDIGGSLKELQRGLSQAKIVEIPQETQANIQDKIGVAIDENLTEGLQSQIKSIEYRTEHGFNPLNIKEEVRNVGKIFLLAKERGVHLTFTPRTETKDSPDDSSIVEVLQTEEEILAYINDRIDRNLLKGLDSKFRSLAHKVSKGFFYKADEFQEELEEWLSFMQERGFEVTNDPINENAADISNGDILIKRQVNRDHLRQLETSTVRENLSEGLQGIIRQTRYKIRTGIDKPLDWVEDHLKDYEQAGEEYGVADTSLKNFVEGEKFNPNLFDSELAKTIEDNIQIGTSAIKDAHGRWIKEGEFGIVDSRETLLDLYIQLAEKYGIQVDAENLRRGMKDNITPQAVQTGINANVEKIRTFLRNGEYYLAESGIRKLREAEQFVNKHGLQNEVDISVLRQYLDEVGIEDPQLPG